MIVSVLPKYDDLLALPWEDEGQGPNSWNCWNLCREIYRRAGLFLPQYSEWIEDISQRDCLIREKISIGDFYRLPEPESMALITLRLCLKEPEKVTHVGVMLDRRRFINVRKRVGVAVEDMHKRIWQDKTKIEGFYFYAK